MQASANDVMMVLVAVLTFAILAILLQPGRILIALGVLFALTGLFMMMGVKSGPAEIYTVVMLTGGIIAAGIGALILRVEGLQRTLDDVRRRIWPDQP